MARFQIPELHLEVLSKDQENGKPTSKNLFSSSPRQSKKDKEKKNALAHTEAGQKIVAISSGIERLRSTKRGSESAANGLTKELNQVQAQNKTKEQQIISASNNIDLLSAQIERFVSQGYIHLKPTKEEQNREFILESKQFIMLIFAAFSIMSVLLIFF